jgi:hypothetical protein
VDHHNSRKILTFFRDVSFAGLSHVLRVSVVNVFYDGIGNIAVVGSTREGKEEEENRFHNFT